MARPTACLITRARKSYLKFWASWCSICLASLPDTDEIAKDAGDDYVVLTVVSPGHKGEQQKQTLRTGTRVWIIKTSQF